MLRKLALITLVPALLAASPALAVSAKEKQETCKIGADSQSLTGAKRSAFIRKCMAKGDYEPAARKEVMKKAKAAKKKPAMKKPAAKKKAAKKPAPKKPDEKKQ
jgi:hypothetical protein